jgi:hypothetical protein
MKDPDCLHNALRDAVAEDMGGAKLDEDEADAVFQLRVEKAQKACARWFRWGEYLTVEIDTDAGTATVIPEKP